MPFVADGMAFMPSWLPTAHCRTEPTKSTNGINPTTSEAQDSTLTHQSDDPANKPRFVLTGVIDPATSRKTRIEAFRGRLDVAKANKYRIALPTTIVHDNEGETSHARQHEPTSEDKAPNEPSESSAAVDITPSSPATDPSASASASAAAAAAAASHATSGIPAIETPLACFAHTTTQLPTPPCTPPTPPPTPPPTAAPTNPPVAPAASSHHHRPAHHRLGDDWVSVPRLDLDDWVLVDMKAVRRRRFYTGAGDGDQRWDLI